METPPLHAEYEWSASSSSSTPTSSSGVVQSSISSATTVLTDGEASASLAAGIDALVMAVGGGSGDDDAKPPLVCSDESYVAQRLFDEGSSSSSAAALLPVLLPVPATPTHEERKEEWFDAAAVPPEESICTWPVHGTRTDLDLTGTWSIRSVAEGEVGEAFHESSDVEHSSFGHIASASCHGWFWGSSGYVQVILPASEEEREKTRHSHDSSSQEDEDSESRVTTPRRDRMHVISLKFKGHSDTCVYLKGTTERGCGSAPLEFEVSVQPRTYDNLAYGDEASRDLTLEVQGSTFRVHSAVVATFMPHVRKVLDMGMQETRERIIPCPGDNPHAWHILLERVYDITGCFHASAALKVLPLLDKYQIPKLWSESVAELKRLPQSPRPHPHVLDLLCRCEAADVMNHWFRVSPPDPEELVLFVRECKEVCLRAMGSGPWSRKI